MNEDEGVGEGVLDVVKGSHGVLGPLDCMGGTLRLLKEGM